jgi:4-methyl-5(b-hydroxyethyl)-thiazole monophosphate biosynthesis
MITRVLVPLADGFEELEAVTLVDTLRRAELEVTMASVGALEVRGSRGVRVLADALWADLDPAAFDAIVLPGGLEGTLTLAEHPGVLAALEAQAGRGGEVAALCAAPLVLDAAGLLEGRAMTCHPSVRERLKGAQARDERVVGDGALVTSQGPGTSLEFALALVARWRGPEVAEALAQAMVAPAGAREAWASLG